MKATLNRCPTFAVGGTFVAAMCVFLGLAGTGLAHAQSAKIVASIMPLHSLVAGVTHGVEQGLGAPYLLVSGSASPHTFALRPSDARALSSAKIVFWVGPGMERFLVRPLASLAAKARIVSLAQAPGVMRLRVAGAYDPHIWLDPGNAKAMVRAIASGLSAADPASAGRYSANAKNMQARLDRLDTEISRTLKPVRAAPFIVIHDAYRYFGRRYGLNQVAAGILGSRNRPSARHMARVRKRLRETKARCIFLEPGTAPGLARAIAQGTSARITVLDPVGVDIMPGRNAYFTIMRRMALGFRECLGKP